MQKNLFNMFVAACMLCLAACGDSGTASNDNNAFSESVIETISCSSFESSSSVVSELSSSIESSGSTLVVDPATVVVGTMTDDRDGQTYKTVTIGTQTWMAENLNYAYIDPTLKLDSSSFCFKNNPDSCSKYGRLYLWSAAMDSVAKFSDDGKGCGYGANCLVNGFVRGVCPEGWHLPSRGDWSTLFVAVGGVSTAGTMLKSSNGWSDSGNGENLYSFNVLPVGGRNDIDFYGVGDFTYFWSSTENGDYYVFIRYFVYDYEKVVELSFGEENAYSVRCLKN